MSAVKRKGSTKPQQNDIDVADVESEEEEQPQEEVKPRKKSGIKKSKNLGKEPEEKEEKKSLNWSAIIIMLMFGIPMLITGAMHVIDMVYPEAAKVRLFRQQIMRCYEAANPSKVSEVDHFVEKYIGRERVLFAKLRTKYEKVPQCHF